LAANPLSTLSALLDVPGLEIDLTQFERCFNLQFTAAQDLYRVAGAVLLNSGRRLAISGAREASLRKMMLDALAAYHRVNPDEAGMTQRALKALLDRTVSADAFLALLKSLAKEELIVTTGALVRLARHSTNIAPADEILWRRVEPWLEDRGPLPFTTADVARELRASDVVVKAMLNRRRRNGDLWRIDEERYLLRDHVASLAGTAALLDKSGTSGFTVGQFRDATGIGRNTVIRLLEFFDAIDVTVRVGEARRMRPDYERVVGSATPYVPRAI
jgi:selenocysteine-specific elongation factor